MRSLISRLNRLEQAAGKAKMPGVLILHRLASGIVVDEQGQTVNPDADFFGLKIILQHEPGSYREPSPGEFTGAQSLVSFPGRYLTPEAWQQNERAGD